MKKALGADANTALAVIRRSQNFSPRRRRRKHTLTPPTYFQGVMTPVSSLIQQRRLKLFGHIARAAASEDHSRALRASTDRLPVDWRRPRGQPRQSWLRTIESDLKPLNLGLYSALRRATDRPSWRRIVEMAMLFKRATR